MPEPSMEEILASIRKIIEGGDEREAASRPVEANDRAIAPAPAQRFALAAGTTGGEARLSEPTTTPFAPPEPSFEDLAGAIGQRAAPAESSSRTTAQTADILDFDFGDFRAELQRELDAEEASERRRQLREDAVSAAGRAAESAGEPAAASEPGSDDLWAHSPGASASQAVRRDGPVAPATNVAPDLSAVFVPANNDDPRMSGFRSAVIEDALGEPAAGEASPLVSSRTGDLVGASFEELARAVREGELRSLGELAEDLMRPMLREWLDENLPKLVERLVREEIERVARGGR